MNVGEQSNCKIKKYKFTVVTMFFVMYLIRVTKPFICIYPLHLY